MDSSITLFSLIVLAVHLLGVANATHAILSERSSQSAIAWGLGLLTFPWIVLPLYWILGRRRFRGYTEAFLKLDGQWHASLHQGHQAIAPYATDPPDQLRSLSGLIHTVTESPFIVGNAAQLLIDGEATYDAMLTAIESAQDYVLLQTYIYRDDAVGHAFQQALIERAQHGVRVYVLYDALGARRLSKSYIRKLRRHGIQIAGFSSSKGRGNRFQLNFRNHRKILVVDGHIGLMGGLNLGEEYLGKSPRLGPWRDTHMQLQGPAVLVLQQSFLKDWYWATRRLPTLAWQPRPVANANLSMLVLPTGPVVPLQDCTYFFNALIHLAQNRLWIASPYLVPDEATFTALKIAALRGVDVRILLPDRADHWLVYLSAFSYYPDMQSVDIKLYRYETGFMHQKVILVDDNLAGVGTVNLDNRSFNLNFEVMTFVANGAFIRSVEQMLLADFDQSRQIDLSDYERFSPWFKLAVRTARLMAPLQ